MSRQKERVIESHTRIQTSMEEEVQSTCQKVELSEKIRVLLSELPLTVKERHRLMDYTKSFLPLWMRVLQCSIDVSIVVGEFLMVSHLMKRRYNSCLI